MDRIVEYRYALGAADELKAGRDGSLKFASDLSGLDVKSPGGLIEVPRFIGVFQTHEPIYDREMPDEGKEILSAVENFLLSDLSNAAGSVIRGIYGVEDKIDPKLIHVIYDSGLPKEVVKLSFGDVVGRMAFSQLGQTPVFADKDVGSMDLALESATSILRGLGNDETLDMLKRSVCSFEEERIKYGLTRLEYVTLQAARRIANGPSRIEANPLAIGLIRKLPSSK